MTCHGARRGARADGSEPAGLASNRRLASDEEWGRGGAWRSVRQREGAARRLLRSGSGDSVLARGKEEWWELGCLPSRRQTDEIFLAHRDKSFFFFLKAKIIFDFADDQNTS